jgi:urease accessory protein
MTTIALSRLLQLSSTMLPVGTYSYSQGLEWAIDSGVVTDASTAKAWIYDVLTLYQAHYELPILARLYAAWGSDDLKAVATWDAYFQAGRDTSEALAETRQMGYSMARLLNDLDDIPAVFLEKMNALDTPAFPALYAGVSQLWGIQLPDMLHAYAWSWLENQVSAAMKTVPLGQVAGQKILLSIGAALPEIVHGTLSIKDDEITNFMPGLSIASARHETQYSRLFRS